MSFVEMILSASMQVKGTYAAAAGRSDYARLGDVVFIPERSPLYCSWAPGAQRCISCMFDVRVLSERAAMEWSWPEFDVQAALDIRNEYVRLGLQRIAEEALSPGFASATQIECSLMFVALELRRHFAGERRIAQPREGKLSARQLQVLRSMVIERPNTSPTISELATECGMNGRQLALAYRRTTGVTLRSFIADARLERAKMLLLGGRTLIKQVAFDSGFQSAAAFIAAFRKSTGMTPIDFRAAMAAQRPH
jgi:AraC family transcriptional regulator